MVTRMEFESMNVALKELSQVHVETFYFFQNLLIFLKFLEKARIFIKKICRNILSRSNKNLESIKETRS